jgi:ribosomal protein L14
VSSIDNLVSLSGRSYISFDNIALQGANARSFSIINSNNITINACDIFYSGQDAVNANSGCSNIAVTNSNISYSNFNGIVASGSSAWTITGNTISNTAAVAGMGGTGEGQYFGIINVKNGSVVALNKITNTGYIPICFQGTNNTIQNNLVDTFCTVKDDGGGIYCGGQSYSGTKVINNIVLNGIGAATGTPDKDSRVHGIYVDDGGSNVEIAANTVAFSGGAGIYNHNSHELNIHDNIAFDNKTTGIKYYNDGNTIANITVTGNIFFAKTSSQFVLNSSGGSANPSKYFASADNNYYCRPLNENSSFQTLVPSAATYNLSGWKSFVGKESNSKVSPITITDSKNIRFEYNASSSSIVVNLGATYMDPKGKNYAGSITLAPYTSAVLLYVSGTVANQSPAANAGQDQSITLPTNTVTLTGSGTDPDGSITSYQWTKVSGPTQFTIASSTLAKTGVSGLTEGVYQFELKVTDNAGATDKDTISVTVNASSNQPPVARAGNSQSITLPTNSVTLDGSSSNDPDGTITSYQWTKILGPSSAVIVNSNLASTGITSLVQGVYQFELKVTDNNGAIGKDTIQVTVGAAANQSPTANAGVDINLTLPTNNTTLSGSGTDPDGTIASYQWSRVSGPSQYNISSPTQSSPSVSNLVQGTYQFQLTVTDNAGATDVDIVQITVDAAPNQMPVAEAGIDINLTLPNNSTTLSGSGNDPDGNIVSYEWSKISGPWQYTISSPTQRRTDVNNLAEGIYEFQLQVTDNSGAIATDIVRITVNGPTPQPNQNPNASAGTDLSITLPTDNVTLNGGGSDPDGNIASYQWTMISGPAQFDITSSTQATTSVDNLTEGVYEFQLQVTDDQGATDVDVVQVTVNAAPPANQPPAANAGADINITLPVNSINLSGAGTDPDGTITSYRWVKIAGPTQYNIASSNSGITSVTNLAQGSYSFELTVTDNSGATAKDTIEVTVNAAVAKPNQIPEADAGRDIQVTLPTNSTRLSGNGSDADGRIYSYRWRSVSGPKEFSFSSTSRASTTVGNLVQGIYNFELMVTDNVGATDRDTVMVTVMAAPPNQAPKANAGTDKILTLPTNSTSLSGSGNDPDGWVSSYKWMKISGPSQYNLSSSTKAQAAVSNLAKGVYQFELTVTDNSGKTGKDTVQVTVNLAAAAPNQAPTANAGLDINITLPTNSVILSGTGTDPDGTIASYQWKKIAGPSDYSIVSATQSRTTVNNLVDGTYQFELTVTDNSGKTAKDTVRVIVNPATLSANHSPTADAGTDMEITLPTNTVKLSGKGKDQDGLISSYKWKKSSGPAEYNIVSSGKAETEVTNLVEGVYQFELTVTDNSNATGRSTMQVTVHAAPNQAPTADAGSDVQVSLPSDTATLTGAGSSDPDGTIAFYKWTKISGGQSTVVSPSKSQTLIDNLTEGIYQFELTVTDNAGASAKDTVEVVVLAVPKAFAKVFPNPATTTVNFQIEGAGRTSHTALRIYDNKGILVYQEDFVRPPQPMIKQVNVSKLPGGIYFAELQTDTNNITTLRFMKK